MTAKHRDLEYRKNSRIIRQQVAVARRRGHDVTCWRCGRLIDPEQRYDVGHRNPNAGHGIENLAPEHRGENRRAGGKQGATKMHRNRARTAGMLPW